MKKKIIVIVTEFQSQFSGVNVDSRMYEENMNPIISKGGINMDQNDWHLGQISSSLTWAVHDCCYERYQPHFDKLFPEQNGNFEFEYRLVSLNTQSTCQK